jgi:hypothetical protein
MKNPHFLMLLGAALFSASLFQPVWRCSINQGTPFDGMTVLISGFMGLLFLDPRWFCNIIVPLAVHALIRPPRHPWLGLVIAAVGTTTIVGPYLCGPGGGALGPGSALATGGYLWIGSLWAFALTMFMQSRADAGGADKPPIQGRKPSASGD